MSVIKGKIEAGITLSKSTCYFMRTGKCSLSVVQDHYLSPSTRINANDLLYCPRLLRAMKSRERLKPLTILPCECGHAEIVSGHQRACIASQQGLTMTVQAADPDAYKPSCTLCSGQMTFDAGSTGTRIVTLKVRIKTDD